MPADEYGARPRYATRVLVLCAAAALLEGVDIQSMGVSAPKLAAAFHLTPAQVGLALSASIFGLMLGAAVGGRASDRFGRRPVLVVSLTILGLFSLGTTLVWDAPSLLVMRVLAGLGLGGVFPSLVALVSETAPPRSRATSLGLMYAGLPAGGVVASAAALWLAASPEWKPIFYLGGLGPLLVAPAMAWGLPKTRPDASGAVGARPALSVPEVLFGPRTASTLLLWTAYFFTLLIVYMLLNWLPSLLVSKGYSRATASLAALVLNLGAAAGSIALGRLMDRSGRTAIFVFTYLGMAAALAGLSYGQGWSLYVAAFAAGLFTVGGQLVLYALAPLYYPEAGRGTGIGAALAVGRIGSILGPLLAGLMMMSGAAGGGGGVLRAAIPGLALALGAVVLLTRRSAGAGSTEAHPILDKIVS